MAALLALALAACSGGGDSQGGTRRHGGAAAGRADSASRAAAAASDSRLVIGLQQEPEVLTEVLQATASNSMIGNLLFSRFVRYDDRMRLVPDVIREVPTRENGLISPDYLTVTYHLRSNAYWHDGVRLTSRDVRFTFDLIRNPQVNVQSRDGWDAVETCETPDDTTVVFRLTRPDPDFVGTAFYEESILPEHILGHADLSHFRALPYHRAPVGSGAYRFVEWVPGSHLILESNPTFYGGTPRISRIVFKFVPSEEALLSQIRSGEIDWFDNLSSKFLPVLRDVPGIRIYRTPMLMYEHLDLNTESPPLSDRRVRRAIALAIDRQKIAARVYDGVVAPAYLEDPPNSPYYDEAVARRNHRDVARAGRLLREAGWWDHDGDGIADKSGQPLRLTVSSTSGQPNRERLELVLRDQLRAIGIDLRIRNYSPTVLFGTWDDGGVIRRGKYQMALYAWLAGPEPSVKSALYCLDAIPPRGQNYTRIRNRELTRVLEEGARTVDPRRRVELYRRASEILVDEAVSIPLFWYTAIDAVTDRLRNFRPNPTPSSDTWNAVEWELVPAESGARSASR